jgi:hypothetical protein
VVTPPRPPYADPNNVAVIGHYWLPVLRRARCPPRRRTPNAAIEQPPAVLVTQSATGRRSRPTDRGAHFLWCGHIRLQCHWHAPYGAGWWSVAIASSMECDANTAPSGASLLQNFDSNHLLFATRAMVPLRTDSGTSDTNAVAWPRRWGWGRLLTWARRTSFRSIRWNPCSAWPTTCVTSSPTSAQAGDEGGPNWSGSRCTPAPRPVQSRAARGARAWSPAR